MLDFLKVDEIILTLGEWHSADCCSFSAPSRAHQQSLLVYASVITIRYAKSNDVQHDS